LRKDLELLEEDTITAFIAGLERHGVNNELIKEALKGNCASLIKFIGYFTRLLQQFFV
jgi:predicted metal-dependent phosphotriesterase family hydrolase